MFPTSDGNLDHLVKVVSALTSLSTVVATFPSVTKTSGRGMILGDYANVLFLITH